MIAMNRLLAVYLALGVLTSGSLFGQTASSRPWHKRPWDPGQIKPCDRACLVQMIDEYVTSVLKKDPASVPTSEETWYTENTARLAIGEGILWRGSVEPTGFRVHAADPVNGQVALQAVFNIEGRPALTVIRLKVERRHITNRTLVDRNVAKRRWTLNPEAWPVGRHAPSETTSRKV